MLGRLSRLQRLQMLWAKRQKSRQTLVGSSWEINEALFVPCQVFSALLHCLD